MSTSELDVALRSREPVICDGVEYAYISAIIYRHGENGQIIIQAELRDKSNNSVTVANPARVKRMGQQC